MAIISEADWLKITTPESRIKIDSFDGSFDFYVDSPYFNVHDGLNFICKEATGRYECLIYHIREQKGQGLMVGLYSLGTREGRTVMKYGTLPKGKIALHWQPI